MQSQLSALNLRGAVRSFRYDADGSRIGSDLWTPNSVLVSWAGALLPLLAGDEQSKYRLAGMYIEFENDGGGAVTPPSFERTDDTAGYYEDLALSSTRDYLRVPILAKAYSRSDEALPYDNVLLLTARTAGVVGQNGLPFTAAAQSRVYGGALIAMPDESDATLDRIFARFYWPSATSQLVKLVGSEIGYDWKLTAN